MGLAGFTTTRRLPAGCVGDYVTPTIPAGGHECLEYEIGALPGLAGYAPARSPA